MSIFSFVLRTHSELHKSLTDPRYLCLFARVVALRLVRTCFAVLCRGLTARYCVLCLRSMLDDNMLVRIKKAHKALLLKKVKKAFFKWEL